MTDFKAKAQEIVTHEIGFTTNIAVFGSEHLHLFEKIAQALEAEILEGG